MTDFYIHAFCLDDAKYQQTDELVLGPYERVGLLWDGVYGYRPDDLAFHPPDNVMFVHDPETGGWSMGAFDPDIGITRFYSDLEILTEEDLEHGYLHNLPLYEHQRDVP